MICPFHSIESVCNFCESDEIKVDHQGDGVSFCTYTPKISRIVEDNKDWTKMDGDNELEKKLNSYLTSTFIYSKQMSSNECIRPAREIIQIFKDCGIEIGNGLQKPLSSETQKTQGN